MRAIVYDEYGGPDVLRLAEVPDPKVGPDSVLLRVEAAAVNPVDWKLREGYLDGIMDVFFPVIPGWDVAGVVEAPGAAVGEFEAGDEVIGYVREDVVRRGTYAEKVAAPVRTLARKPRNLDWAQAASLPLAGLTAYQSVVHALKVTESDTLLVHAAAGGVGAFAVQIARALGARVIGTASERNHDFLRSIGAEPVSYGDGLAGRVREIAPGGVSAVLDLVGGPALDTVAEVGAAGVRVASIVDTSVKEQGGTYVFVRPSAEDLTALVELVEAGKVAVEVSEVFPLEKAADAHRLSAEGHTRGKVAIRIG
ncbi:NADP-dependent oxidoreductase [Marinitenerispora sediminis]|uniref:Alcohol dehydrogenase n=1 Tax=Marinitenerispora sediminis TaxID=1931232 RepID=A0A368TC47_9ACTN|nr:NADP-dependent oxidoreductase [Marinitenerispora sediminis]RCV58149.1 alcohol dehydrogenase [Marinitenerispora sediminis]RCV61440.1 alcohol dehydrogenase [Marinitenerispora sediminis]RCV62520.1 alcohol dehydrogenase [Marinitenerispora sediminis]